MEVLHLTEQMDLKRAEWMKKIQVAGPKFWDKGFVVVVVVVVKNLVF